MITVEAYSDAIQQAGIEVLTGVPCSYLRAFVSYASTGRGAPYYAAASEGEAIGLAAGAYLGGKMAMVLVQNSGLGNCVNPLTSLATTFNIPMVLMVSHRGGAGPDAPQHELMGRITHELLSVMEMPAETLAQESAAATAQLEALVGQAASAMGPVGLVVPKGSFGAFNLDPAGPQWAAPASIAAPDRYDGPLSTRFAALQAIDAALAAEDLVVSTTGMSSRELYMVRDRPQNFYMMGSMGCALSVGLGVAIVRDTRKVIVIDGDGALLMKLGSLATVGHYQPKGLLHVVLDNATYETTGSQPTSSTNVCFEQIAAASGYASTASVDGPESLGQQIDAFQVGDGPRLVTMRIQDGHQKDVPRVGRTPSEIRDAFKAEAER